AGRGGAGPVGRGGAGDRRLAALPTPRAADDEGGAPGRCAAVGGGGSVQAARSPDPAEPEVSDARECQETQQRVHLAP
ncbi:hypothetical protein R0J90_23935, partial [Micrococcus sp. SIMBA_144]